jgi:CarD family transcriptional regulator
MSSAEDAFAKGDWIVHSYYGIGKVKKIEKKRVNGKEKRFYRVESEDTTYWIPLDRASESHVRALAKRSTLRRALRLLTKEPTEMDSNFKSRQKRIREVLANGKLRSLIRLVRDLWARGQENKLSMTEVGALRQAMDNLTDEVAVAEGISDEDALAKLQKLLEQQDIEPKKGSSTGLVEQLLRRVS